MNLRKFISEHIVDLGDNNEKAESVKQNVPAKQPKRTEVVGNIHDVVTPQPVTQLTSVPGSIVSESDFQEARAHFANILKDSNKPGNDFYEFNAAKNAMKSVPVESERYVAAFTALSYAGLTMDILLSSAEFYKGVIQKEKQDFDKEYAQVRKLQVEDKQAIIEGKRKEMTQLNERIAALNGEIVQMGTEVQQGEQKLVLKKNVFDLAAKEAVDTLEQEMDKIKRYLQPA